MLTGTRRRWGVAALVLAAGGRTPASAQQPPPAPPALSSPEAARSHMPTVTSYPLAGAAPSAAPPLPAAAEPAPPPALEVVLGGLASPGLARPRSFWERCCYHLQ